MTPSASPTSATASPVLQRLASLDAYRGFVMFLMDHGLRWERTEKIDANHHLIRSRGETTEGLPGPEGG